MRKGGREAQAHQWVGGLGLRAFADFVRMHTRSRPESARARRAHARAHLDKRGEGPVDGAPVLLAEARILRQWRRALLRPLQPVLVVD